MRLIITFDFAPDMVRSAGRAMKGAGDPRMACFFVVFFAFQGGRRNRTVRRPKPRTITRILVLC
jgi:hypothetical protein